MKKEKSHGHHRNTKDNKRLLQVIIAQWHGRNGQVIRKVQASKTEPGRNWKYEPNNDNH